MNENTNVKPAYVSPLKHICMTIGELPSSYIETMSYYEMLVWFCEYLRNTVIPTVNNNASAVQELQQLYKDLQNYVNNYFDNLDVQEEIDNKIDDMVESGEFQQILATIPEFITSNTFNLQRIGRKLVKGTNSNSSDYSSSGVACNMQGGCIIDENTIAYCLWDSLNPNLNKNKIVIQNKNTGEILRQQDFTFGWCNSLAYNDGKLYVCVRGTTTDDTPTNNGIIKVVDVDTLSLIDTYTLAINCNALSINDDKLYILEENTNKIYLYDLLGNYLMQSITISYDISDNYNQDILVTDNNIYLISTRPSNTLRVFDKNGSLLKTYNVLEYGGIYKIGEMQWLDIIDDTYLLLGSNIMQYEECINQFFKFSLTKNIATNNFQENYAQTIQVDSAKSYYNPNGTSGNEFTSINEVNQISIDNIIVAGNSKEYDYTEFSNKKMIRIQNATFNHGLYLQYGNYYLITTTVKNSVNTSFNGCLYTRFSHVGLNNVTLNGNNTSNYCIVSGNSNDFKFTNVTFSNYVSSVFNDNIPSDVVNTNDLSNVPYIPRAYGHEYNLMSNGFINQYKQGTYNFNTSLSSSQIEELFTNASKIQVVYIGLNKASNQYVTFEKSSSGGYTISDTTVAGSSFNFRCSKAILTINKNGVTISSNKCSQITYDGTDITCNHLSSEDSGSNAENFIQIRAVKIIV